MKNKWILCTQQVKLKKRIRENMCRMWVCHYKYEIQTHAEHNPVSFLLRTPHLWPQHTEKQTHSRLFETYTCWQGLLTGKIEEWLRNGRCHCLTAQCAAIRPQTSTHSLSLQTAVFCKILCVCVSVCPNVTIPVPCTEEAFVFQSQSVKTRGCWKEQGVEE